MIETHAILEDSEGIFMFFMTSVRFIYTCSFDLIPYSNLDCFDDKCLELGENVFAYIQIRLIRNDEINQN